MADIFTFPTRILFGPGSRKFLAKELSALGAQRPLIVSDLGVTASGVLDQALHAIGEQPEAFFGGVDSNPTEQNVREGARVYAEHQCDSIVAVGGGSTIDAGKAIAVKATHAPPLADLHADWRKIHAPLPPVIAIPTTAGTGSEVGYATVIALDGLQRKVTIISPHLLPSVAICDPELTRGLPRSLTAGTGMDALSHCVEAYLSTRCQPLCDGIVLEGLRYVRTGLLRAFRNGADLDARGEMMLAAMMGGVGIHKGLGVAHALVHAIGSEVPVHHGTAMAVLLPHAIRFNAEAAGAKIVALARALGTSLSATEPRAAADQLAGHVRDLGAQMRLPSCLGDLGLGGERFDATVGKALEDPALRTNPRPCGEPELQTLLEQAAEPEA